MSGCETSRAGFSLVEVCLAVLVVGLGLVAIFGLFPSGLRSSEEATGDTRAAMFAEHAFGALRANAEGMTWSEWTNENAFAGRLMEDTRLIPAETRGFPERSGQMLQYGLSIGFATKSATLQVCDGQAWVTNSVVTFYTEFAYSGM